VSWIIAFLGFALLIILHEAGHFATAKAVGMHVPRFSLFFGRPLLSVRRGETEYAIGPIPLGGYVKISGMSPEEELPPEIAPRAYFRQKVWKRIVVILAGPAVNLLIAFLILWALFLVNGTDTSNKVGKIEPGQPAASVLRPGDALVAVDGRRGSPDALARQVATHRCADAQFNGCSATAPATLTIERGGRTLTFPVVPRYDAKHGRARVGFSYAAAPIGPLRAGSLSLQEIWRVTSQTVERVVGAFFNSSDRKQLHSVVGGFETTRQALTIDATTALYVLALISLSLAVINLFPFLPLDGGHVFWALAEKLRGRPIQFATLERAGVLGFTLIIALFLIGVSNDINQLAGPGFKVR
jgi:regulator of sigma E protease